LSMTRRCRRLSKTGRRERGQSIECKVWRTAVCGCCAAGSLNTPFERRDASPVKRRSSQRQRGPLGVRRRSAMHRLRVLPRGFGPCGVSPSLNFRSNDF
jgi:hypothetical protein